MNWTSAADFPFSTIIVEREDLWRKQNPKPLAIYSVSADLRHFAIVPGASFPN